MDVLKDLILSNPIFIGVGAIIVIVIGALLWKARRAIAILILLAGIVAALIWLWTLGPMRP